MFCIFRTVIVLRERSNACFDYAEHTKDEITFVSLPTKKVYEK